MQIYDLKKHLSSPLHSLEILETTITFLRFFLNIPRPENANLEVNTQTKSFHIFNI